MKFASWPPGGDEVCRAVGFKLPEVKQVPQTRAVFNVIQTSSKVICLSGNKEGKNSIRAPAVLYLYKCSGSTVSV